MRCIGIDLGYGRTKMFAGNACKSNCPSVVSSQIPVHTFGDTALHPVEVKGIAYLVGDEAERHARSVEDTRRIDFVCSPSWFALLGNALRIARFDHVTDALAIGLPPGDLGPEKEEMVRKEIRQTPIKMLATGKTYVLDKTKVLIVPQGAGIYFCYTMNHYDALAQDIAVIDVGHETLDMIYMSKGTYIEKWKDTKNLGVSRELDAIIQLERSSLRGKRLGYGALVAHMAHDRGLITEGSSDYVAGALELLQAYTRTVMSTIQAYLDLTQGADVCLIGGGGARFLVPDRDYGYLVLDDPEMANAIGYWAWAVAQT
jgi:hypothetical protein